MGISRQPTPCAFLPNFQNSLHKQLEELERDSLVTLNVERLKGTYGRITIAWEATGSVSDVFPTSGVVCNLRIIEDTYNHKSCLLEEILA